MVLARYDYDLRADGKRVGVTETDDLGRTTRIDWAYDALGRLAGERYDSFGDSEDYTSEFAYDLAYNRIEKRVDHGSDGSMDVVTRSVFDANDRTLTETTDSADNTEDRFTRFEFTGTQQTRKTVYRGTTDNNPRESDTRYSYNLQGALGRVVARQYGDTGILVAESATDFQYDADGVRVAETDVNSGTRREFLIDHQNPTGHAKPIEERASGLLVRSYTLGSTVLDQHDAQGTTQPGSKLLLFDGHGSTRLLWGMADMAASVFWLRSFARTNSPNSFGRASTGNGCHRRGSVALGIPSMGASTAASLASAFNFSAMSCGSAASPWPATQSATSYPWGDSQPLGGASSTTRTIAGGSSPANRLPTPSAYLWPGVSASGRITTSRPASGAQSVLAHAWAPPLEVVASSSSVASASTHFSPSTNQTVAAGSVFNPTRL